MFYPSLCANILINNTLKLLIPCIYYNMDSIICYLWTKLINNNNNGMKESNFLMGTLGKYKIS